jgi:hypothetical protein
MLKNEYARKLGIEETNGRQELENKVISPHEISNVLPELSAKVGYIPEPKTIFQELVNHMRHMENNLQNPNQMPSNDGDWRGGVSIEIRAPNQVPEQNIQQHGTALTLGNPFVQTSKMVVARPGKQRKMQ